MSFRLFIYYCAIVGGFAALVGWMLGRLVYPAEPVVQAGVRGMFLGMAVALGLGLVDALWHLTLRRLGQVLVRAFTGLGVGAVGGFVGGMLGQLLYQETGLFVFFVFGWVL